MIGLVLSPEQFKTLLRVVYVANTVANAHRDDKNFLGEYDDFEQYIFARAKEAGFSAVALSHEVDGAVHHHPSPIFESDTELAALMDAYDEHTALEVLAENLAERDIEKKYGPNAKDRMPASDYEELLEDRALEYEKLFEERGFDAITVPEIGN